MRFYGGPVMDDGPLILVLGHPVCIRPETSEGALDGLQYWVDMTL